MILSYRSKNRYWTNFIMLQPVILFYNFSVIFSNQDKYVGFLNQLSTLGYNSIALKTWHFRLSNLKWYRSLIGIFLQFSSKVFSISAQTCELVIQVLFFIEMKVPSHKCQKKKQISRDICTSCSTILFLKSSGHLLIWDVTVLE